MASETQVKQYLAYWFQLGKKLVFNNGQEVYSPQSVIAGDRFSAEFEDCWQQILDRKGQKYHLEGTNQTLADLLSDRWEIAPCARCNMTVPVIRVGLPSVECPCNDLPLWPNSQVPGPHLPVDSQQRLLNIQERLQRSNLPKNG